ncbi:hypothetical protein BGY98DRAFT_951222, partial [Russula aff. rugulosa BPL654]
RLVQQTPTPDHSSPFCHPGRLPIVIPTASWLTRRPIAATYSSVHMCPYPEGVHMLGFPMNRFAPSD